MNLAIASIFMFADVMSIVTILSLQCCSFDFLKYAYDDILTIIIREKMFSKI